MRFAIACAVLAGSALAAHARTFDGVVTHVGDGDTIWVRAQSGGPAQPVRILGIDAPEICQAGGPQARDALADRVEHRQVRIDTQGQDDFGRTLGRVELRGEDIGGWLVREGHAWSYRFRRDPGPYVRDEKLARLAHRGLWRDAHPTEPRVFRRWHGPCSDRGG